MIRVDLDFYCFNVGSIIPGSPPSSRFILIQILCLFALRYGSTLRELQTGSVSTHWIELYAFVYYK